LIINLKVHVVIIRLISSQNKYKIIALIEISQAKVKMIQAHKCEQYYFVCSDLKAYTKCPQLVHVPYVEWIEL